MAASLINRRADLARRACHGSTVTRGAPGQG